MRGGAGTQSRRKRESQSRKCQDANLSPFQIWGGESLALLRSSPPPPHTPGLEDSVSLAQFLSCIQ